MSSYREQFFEWVNKQPVYQDMTLQIKEMTLNLVDCWLNNNQAYFHYARLNGKGFAKRCAIDFCWFIKNQTIADLQHRLEVAEKALELAVKDKCKFENALLSTSLGIAGGKVAVPKKEQYYIEQAKEMLENE